MGHHFFGNHGFSIAFPIFVGYNIKHNLIRGGIPMICWRCKHQMPDGLKYCGHCGVRMNRVAYAFEWLFSRKGLPVLILLAALLLGGLAWWLIPKLTVPAINIDFDLDMGLYTPSDDDIVYSDDSQSFGYVSNMILIFFTRDAEPDRIGQIIAELEGEVVGIMPGVNQYQVKVTNRTEEELEQLRKQLMTYDEVKHAVIDYVSTVEGETSALPNDPWTDPSGQNAEAIWSEETPSGANWWVEAAHVLSAWEYQEYFSNIKVGIADNGFDLSHEDLNITVLNEEVNSAEGHGTHVAGIIGATHNNGLGISGVLGNVTLYGTDCFTTSEQEKQNIPISTLLGGIDLCLSQGCRVVNMSAGMNPDYTINNPDAVRKNAWNTVEYLIMMLDYSQEDFLIVKSAGNAALNAHDYNGYFCSIDRELVQEVLDQMKADGVKLEKDITVEDVMTSFLVVGAVDYPTQGESYQLADFSNYGDSVSICAPGVHILSTVPSGSAYDFKNGTSMAAPVVTGIAAMVWSVDPTMPAEQVRDILISSATEPVLPVTSGDNGSYYLVDARAAVEMALEIRNSKPTDPPEDPTDPSDDATQPPEDPTETSEAPTQSTEPLYQGNPVIPDLACYLGDLCRETTASRRLTDGVNPNAVGYLHSYSVDISARDRLMEYLDLLVKDYHFTLVTRQDGDVTRYLLRFTGAIQPEMFSNDHHYLIMVSPESEDSFLLEFVCERSIGVVKIPYPG